MTEQRPRYVIGSCAVAENHVLLGNYIPIPRTLPIADPENFYFNCSYALCTDSGVQCKKRDLAECTVVSSLLEQLLTERGPKKKNEKKPQQAPNLVGPRTQQAYLSAQQNLNRTSSST